MPADPLVESSQPTFLSLAAKTAVCHTLTYFIMGALAYHFLNYAELIAKPCSGMRPVSDPLVMAGPILQPVRAVLFAAVFYPFRERLFGGKHGWLLMSWMLIALGILGTFAAPAGSLEGLIYTTTPVLMQLRGWLEIVLQALLLSALLCYWVNHPEKKWLTWLLSLLFCLLVVFFGFVLVMHPVPR
jgi:magnesium-transporting ATPase (P-type)